MDPITLFLFIATWGAIFFVWTSADQTDMRVDRVDDAIGSLRDKVGFWHFDRSVSQKIRDLERYLGIKWEEKTERGYQSVDEE